MAEIVNLRTARKRRDRALKQRTAEENRVLHGQRGGDKAALKAEAERQHRLIEGHRRDGGEREE